MNRWVPLFTCGSRTSANQNSRWKHAIIQWFAGSYRSQFIFICFAFLSLFMPLLFSFLARSSHVQFPFRGLISVRYQSNGSFNIHGNLNFWRLASLNSPPSGQKSRSNTPPISSEIPLLKDKFRLQSNTVHTFQREMSRDDTFRLFLKTLLKALFPNKGEILSCKFVKPCKNRKTHKSITPEQEINQVQNSSPFQGNVQIPPSPGTMHSQMPGVCPGVDV